MFILSAIGLLGVLWIVQWKMEKQIARVYVLPLRGASAMFVPGQGTGKDWLIDCGDAQSADHVLKPFLHAQGLNRLDNLCLTVGHQQHVDGAEFILNNFTTRHIYTSFAQGRAPAWKRILAELETSKRWEKLGNGDTCQGWQVLHPESYEDFTKADDKALVLRREINGCSLLFLSDLGRLGQNALIQRHPDLRADIVIGGLPISDEPLSDDLLDLVRPKLIIVVDSEYPALRRASDHLRARLARRGLPVLYGRETGALTLLPGNTGWEVRDASGTTLLQQ